jgi:adenosylhomocysteine nucleosidase
VVVANGPGPKLAGEAVDIAKGRQELSGLVSTGFCGALDPALKPSDILIATDVLGSSVLSRDREGVGAFFPAAISQHPHQTGTLLSIDHVAVRAAEKSQLRQTGASAIEMEAAGVAAKAKEYNLAFYCIRVVTDTADENMPLDFNTMRDANGRFSRSKILVGALRNPAVFPKLLKLNKRCKDASHALGDFIADTRF